MLEIDESIVGDLTIGKDTRLRGSVTGNVTVATGAKLELHGMIVGSLFVEKGASAEVRGTVSQTLVNRGGAVEIWGMVGEGIVDYEEGGTTVHAGAMIGDP